MKNRADFLTNLMAAVGTVMQPDELWQWICLILTIISVALSIAFTIYQWWKAAFADGKLSSQEAQELVNIVNDAADTINKLGDKK